ncbi:MAG: hypothetical protein WCE73_07600 [Candidatus Angelobacter sp.]
MRFLVLMLLSSLFVFAKDVPKPILVSHNDIQGPIIGFSHTEDFQVFMDGHVRYSESGNDRKTGTFNTRLTPGELHRLTVLLNSKEMRAVPAEIPSQIRVVDFDWEAQLKIQHGSGQQTIAVKNFYPLLNTQRPTYPKALIELECILRDVQARATKRPVHSEDQDWCPEKAQ